MRDLRCAWVGCLFILAGQAALGATSEYVFVRVQSTITQTGGFAGVHWTYAIDGRFRLAIDSDARVASFTSVDASATGDSRTLNPNDVFNMTGLTGTVVSDTSIRFTGKADDGSSVLLTLTLKDNLAHLTGGTAPPVGSADFFVFSLDAVAQRKYAGGVGEATDPYQIATAADLIALGETPEDYDKHFVLTADIDLDPNLPGGRVFDKAVIAPDANEASTSFDGTGFDGVFAGNGHTISHLTIAGGSYLGMFGSLSWWAQVKDLGVVDINVVGSGDVVGGLVGENYGDVTTSYSTGSVNGLSLVGGLAGINGGCVSQCYNTSSVSGDQCVGGLVGLNIGQEGRAARPGAISSCYSRGAVDGEEFVGGLVGGNDWSTGEEGIVADSFWDTETSGQTTSDGGTRKTTAEMQTAQTFLDAGWDFLGELTNGVEDTWWILEGRDYPHLWWEKVLGDDFEDGEAGPQWMVFEVDPELVQIKEVNGRLEVTASAAAQNVDAFYVSQDWRLDVTQDFAIRVDYHFTKTGGGDGRVTIGLLPSIEMPVTRWAEFEVGCFDSGPFYLYELRDGYWVQEQTSKRSADEGTLYVSYNPAADELYFSHTGYGKPNAWRTVTGLLKGRWASEPVYVILGGGSEGLGFDGADAWLDNFAVQAGAILE